jgi:selenocysteine lyase/cysteine desulfurase
MGLGFLVVGEGGMEHFNPSIIPHTTSGGEACGLAAQETAASRGEVGTTDLAARAGFAVALEMFGDIGVGTIERHVRGLTARLRAGLTDLPNVQMIGNLPPERSSGISSFGVEGWQAQQHRELVDRLYRQERILVKFQPEFAGIRVSLASFNSIEEIERLLEALQPFVSSPVL